MATAAVVRALLRAVRNARQRETTAAQMLHGLDVVQRLGPERLRALRISDESIRLLRQDHFAEEGAVRAFAEVQPDLRSALRAAFESYRLLFPRATRDFVVTLETKLTRSVEEVADLSAVWESRWVLADLMGVRAVAEDSFNRLTEVARLDSVLRGVIDRLRDWERLAARRDVEGLTARLPEDLSMLDQVGFDVVRLQPPEGVRRFMERLGGMVHAAPPVAEALSPQAARLRAMRGGVRPP